MTKTIKTKILDFVEKHPYCTAKTLEQKFNINHSNLSLLTGYFLKPTKTDPRHLKPIIVNKHKYLWVVSTESIHIHFGYILDYVPTWSHYYTANQINLKQMLGK